MTHIYSMQRKQWIDLGRGLCMSAIIFFHTEIYYCGSEVVPYSVFAQNAITLFFFLSGYLFCSDREYSLHDKLAYILRRLVVPYFLFTIPISIIKPFVYGERPCAVDIVVSEISGSASWFVAALVTAELLFSLMVWKFGKNKLAIGLSAIIMLMFSVIFGNTEDAYIYNKVNIWHVNEAFIAFFCMALGFMYRMEEKRMDGYIGIPVLLVLGVLLVAIKYYETAMEMNMIVSPTIISFYPLFIADIIIFIIIFINMVKKMPSLPYMMFVGRNSLYHYFLCGASPTLSAIIMRRLLPYEGNFITILPAFILSMIICSLTVKAIIMAVGKR